MERLTSSHPRRARLPLAVMALGGFLAGVVLLLARPAGVGAQITYIPRPPINDSIPPDLRPFNDPRIAPHDAWNPISRDPRVPKNEWNLWVNRDYFALEGDAESRRLLPIVENGHLGAKTNPRGFWKYYNDGRVLEAIPDLKYVLWVFPNHPKALQLLCMCSKQLKRPEIPIAFFEKAIKLFPNRAYTYAQYGAYLVNTGEMTLGITELERALALDPDLLQARAWLTRARRELGLPDTTAVGSAQGWGGTARRAAD